MDPILLQKNFVAKAEIVPEGEAGTPGEFVALVSAFGNEDSQGDIVDQGAFTKTLAEWVVKGRPIPVVWAHQFHDPDAFLGQYSAAEETEDGLKLTGLLDLEHPKAARVHKLMSQGLIVEFSISGLVREYELLKDDDEESWFPAMRIKDIDLWEAGPCFKGANANTELISVKNLAAAVPLLKEGRVLAQKHVDALKDAHTKLGEIITAVEKTPEDAAGTEKQHPAATPNVRALLELNIIH
jgi:HK97 family phage prohead protease